MNEAHGTDEVDLDDLDALRALRSNGTRRDYEPVVDVTTRYVR